LEHADELIKEISDSLHSVDDEQANALVDEILRAQKIFVTGSGRSGLSSKAFAMRMMHMGLPVYVVGEIVTPSLHKGDLLIVCSGSGATRGNVIMAEKAKELGGRVALVTIARGSIIGKIADLELFIHAPSPKLKKQNFSSIQPMGSLFEQCVLLVLDIVILKLMGRKNINSDEMCLNHVNLE
jgi:6-phospho-3-hexuloisomerase